MRPISQPNQAEFKSIATDGTHHTAGQSQHARLTNHVVRTAGPYGWSLRQCPPAKRRARGDVESRIPLYPLCCRRSARQHPFHATTGRGSVCRVAITSRTLRPHVPRATGISILIAIRRNDPALITPIASRLQGSLRVPHNPCHTPSCLKPNASQPKAERLMPHASHHKHRALSHHIRIALRKRDDKRLRRKPHASSPKTQDPRPTTLKPSPHTLPH